MMTVVQVASLSRIRLIVGLGNPGHQYVGTRHNVGRESVQCFAKKIGTSFSLVSEFEGQLAQVNIHNRNVFLLLPETYMNESGRSVQKVSQYYKISAQETVVVADEMAFQVGFAQLNFHGGNGGHNGLKSVEQHLETKKYPRLRIGIDRAGDCRRHVLETFTQEEKERLPKEEVIKVLEALCMEDFFKVATRFNTRTKSLRTIYGSTRTTTL